MKFNEFVEKEIEHEERDCTDGVAKVFRHDFDLLSKEIEEFGEKIGEEFEEHHSILRKITELTAIIASKKYLTAIKIKNYFVWQSKQPLRDDQKESRRFPGWLNRLGPVQ